jgi:hypothetical protein
MSDTNIFEQATRASLRFKTDRGELTTEQVWDLMLTSLDSLARGVNKELKDVSEESFIPKAKSAAQTKHQKLLELRLEILKHIIAVKIEEADAKEAAAVKAAKRTKILEALAEKDDDALKGKTREELLKEYDEL